LTHCYLTEDKDFYKNQGVNWLSLAIRPILSLGHQGGSSITQQLIKNNVIADAKGEFWQTGFDAFDSKFAKLERKIAEIPMAVQANRIMFKDEILAAYLSMNYMGTVSGVDLQGFAVASQEFFETSLFDLSDPTNAQDLARVAILSVIIQSPSSFLLQILHRAYSGDNECRLERLSLPRAMPCPGDSGILRTAKRGA
jgi:membrane peptidoglycan carboxypeptidase